MTRQEFNNSSFHANTWVAYQNELKYVIAINFDEALFALTDEKADIHPEEWRWVRCESVTVRPKLTVVESHKDADSAT